jgi:sugar-phosphatase
MTRISCRAVLFDLDGVLVDSTPAVERVWAGWAAEHGFDSQTVTHMAHGRPSISTIRDLLPNGDVETENREVERREIEDVAGVVPLPGTLEVLAALPQHRWTIVTSCTRRLAEVRLRAAGLPVPAKMVTSTDIANGKPHPEPYLKGAAALGIAASDCIVIEDAGAGIRSGKAAGARVIALRTTSPEEELRAAGADWFANDCSEIIPDVSSGLDPYFLDLHD